MRELTTLLKRLDDLEETLKSAKKEIGFLRGVIMTLYGESKKKAEIIKEYERTKPRSKN